MTTMFRLEIATPCQPLAVPGRTPCLTVPSKNRGIETASAAKLPTALTALSPGRLVFPAMPTPKAAAAVRDNAVTVAIGGVAANLASQHSARAALLIGAGAVTVVSHVRFPRDFCGRTAFGFGQQPGRSLGDVVRGSVADRVRWLDDQARLDGARLFSHRAAATPGVRHATAAKDI